MWWAVSGSYCLHWGLSSGLLLGRRQMKSLCPVAAVQKWAVFDRSCDSNKVFVANYNLNFSRSLQIFPAPATSLQWDGKSLFLTCTGTSVLLGWVIIFSLSLWCSSLLCLTTSWRPSAEGNWFFLFFRKMCAFLFPRTQVICPTWYVLGGRGKLNENPISCSTW